VYLSTLLGGDVGGEDVNLTSRIILEECKLSIELESSRIIQVNIP
jgi:hypothetical protein